MYFILKLRQHSPNIVKRNNQLLLYYIFEYLILLEKFITINGPIYFLRFFSVFAAQKVSSDSVTLESIPLELLFFFHFMGHSKQSIFVQNRGANATCFVALKKMLRN